MCVTYNYFSITLTKILITIETASTAIQESIFGQIKLMQWPLLKGEGWHSVVHKELCT
jgi:hypothetical protein